MVATKLNEINSKLEELSSNQDLPKHSKEYRDILEQELDLLNEKQQVLSANK